MSEFFGLLARARRGSASAHSELRALTCLSQRFKTLNNKNPKIGATSAAAIWLPILALVKNDITPPIVRII
ncbi:MAG: hypothetical protein CL397_15370 [Acidiferrobacteraceae bacterium]|nr:hypothetical protein [Acidiferrobacteraceae bacterium]